MKHQIIYRLKQLRQPLDIMMSHDWPNGVVVYHGNKEGLLRKKPFFKEDVQRNELGSTPAWYLLKELRPRCWFSGHLHVKFAAKINHGLDVNQSNPRNKNSVTRFLALDKCLPRRDVLQILKIDCLDQSAELTYDEEWLAVLRSTAELTTASMKSRLPPELLLGKADFSVDRNEMDQLLKVMNNDMKIPLNFEKDSQCEYSPENPSSKRSMDFRTNQQTISFCRKLNILDPIAVLNGSADTSFNASSASIRSEWDEMTSTIISNVSINPDEIEIDDEDDDEVENTCDEPVNEDVEKTVDIKAMSENATANSCVETRSVQSQHIVTTPLRGSGKPSMKLPAPSSSTSISSRSSGSFKDVMISFDASDHSVSPVARRHRLLLKASKLRRSPRNDQVIPIRTRPHQNRKYLSEETLHSTYLMTKTAVKFFTSRHVDLSWKGSDGRESIWRKGLRKLRHWKNHESIGGRQRARRGAANDKFFLSLQTGSLLPPHPSPSFGDELTPPSWNLLWPWMGECDFSVCFPIRLGANDNYDSSYFAKYVA